MLRKQVKAKSLEFAIKNFERNYPDLEFIRIADTMPLYYAKNRKKPLYKSVFDRYIIDCKEKES